MIQEDKLNALSSVVPAEVVELLKAYDHAAEARQYFSDQYDKAYHNGEEGCMNAYFIADKGIAHIAAIADDIWSRAVNMIHNWLCGDEDF